MPIDPQDLILDLLANQQVSPETADKLLQSLAPTTLPVVAACGAALRVPGASNLAEFWSLLQTAQPQTSRFSRRRLDLVLQATDQLRNRYRHLADELVDDSRALGNWLEDLDEFNPEAFGLQDFEAMHLGPNERLMLSLSREALIAACIEPEALAGTATGVFLAHNPDAAFPYVRLFEDPDERAVLSGIPANVAYRVAYTYDLRGPVMNIDTTCSASLVALHVARRSLQLGECDTAIVGGVSLDLLPFQHHDSTSFVVSPRRLCNAYDAAADGTIWGEGAGVVVLRRVEDARADGNPILATIEGSAVTSDGTSNGLAAPNPGAHTATVRSALAEANIDGGQIGYVEGHGAGTTLGDQVEISALSEALGSNRQVHGFCSLGSCKTVTGHLKDAAGIIGFISALLRVTHAQLPALASLQNPNPSIDWDHSPLRLDRHSQAWETSGPRYAGVSSLGLSGTNAHMILKEAPISSVGHSTLAPILLSAPTRESLWKLVGQLVDDLPTGCTVDQVAATFARRELQTTRIAVLADDREALQEKLGRVSAIRAFERVPVNFADQGIFLADTDQSRTLSLKAIQASDHTHSPLINQFLLGEDVTNRYREVTSDVAPIGLPVAPLSTRRIWPREARGEVDVSDLFFDVRWDVDPAPTERERLGTVVVVADSEAEAQAFHSVGAERAHRIITLTRQRGEEPPGQRDSTGNVFTGPLDREETYSAVWESLGPEVATVSDIVFLVPTTARPAMESLDELISSQHHGVVSLFTLAKSLLAAPMQQGVTLAVVACEAQPIGTPSADYDPSRTTGFGLLRVASQEMPHLLELCIDHQESDPLGVAEMVLRELEVPDHNRARQVAWRAGERLTRTVYKQAEPRAQTPLPLPQGGTYVIAGGTGVLGAELTNVLAERGAGQVFLLSRSGLPESNSDDPEVVHRLAAIRAAEELGCVVTSLRCDITRPNDVAAAFEQIDARADHIDGGYMLTKQLFHRWIGELDASDFVAGVENRVVGTWLLAEALRSRGAGHLVLFSSISSMSGTKGAAECASVNQYLDAAAPYLSAQGLPTYTLNLPLILRDRSGFNAITPIPPIDMVQFRGALGRFLDNPHRLDVVARVDWKEALYVRPVLRIPFADELWEQNEQLHDHRSQPECPELVERVDTRDALAQAWNKSLGTEPRPDAHFFNEGGSSLSVIALVRNLKQLLGREAIGVADVYATPEFGVLSSKLDEETMPTSVQEHYSAAEVFTLVESGKLSPEQAAAALASGRIE